MPTPPAPVPLYRLGSEIEYMHALIEEHGGELDHPVVADAFRRLVAALEREPDMLDSYHAWVRQLKGYAAVCESEVAEWKLRKVAYLNAAERAIAEIRLHLERTKRTHLVTPKGRSFSICGNGGVAPLWIDPGATPENVPECFVVVTRELNHAAIRAALEKGDRLDFAELKPRGSHLRVT